MERDFDLEDINIALADCDGDKAPGPDGFNFAFVRASWSFLEDDFCQLFQEFHHRGKLNKELNATFLTLIPKIPNPAESKDFEPISLVGSVYKLISKMLPNRLKVALPFIIGPFQGAFVNGRQILDEVHVANKLIHSRKRSGKEGIIFKIDMEKAYDHVEWALVDCLLFVFRFGDKLERGMYLFFLFGVGKWVPFADV